MSEVELGKAKNVKQDFSTTTVIEKVEIDSKTKEIKSPLREWTPQQWETHFDSKIAFKEGNANQRSKITLNEKILTNPVNKYFERAQYTRTSQDMDGALHTDFANFYTI